MQLEEKMKVRLCLTTKWKKEAFVLTCNYKTIKICSQRKSPLRADRYNLQHATSTELAVPAASTEAQEQENQAKLSIKKTPKQRSMLLQHVLQIFRQALHMTGPTSAVQNSRTALPVPSIKEEMISKPCVTKRKFKVPRDFRTKQDPDTWRKELNLPRSIISKNRGTLNTRCPSLLDLHTFCSHPLRAGKAAVTHAVLASTTLKGSLQQYILHRTYKPWKGDSISNTFLAHSGKPRGWPLKAQVKILLSLSYTNKACIWARPNPTITAATRSSTAQTLNVMFLIAYCSVLSR